MFFLIRGLPGIFLSLVLSKKFSDAPMTLDYPLEVEIVDDRLVSASRVQRGCVFNMFNKKYSIDLGSAHLYVCWTGPFACWVGPFYMYIGLGLFV